MHFRSTALPGVLVFTPTPHHDERGFFSRTADARTLVDAGIDPAGFVQDSQSRSRQGVVRGLHGRTGDGEAKLVRCAHGALHDVVVDARPDSPTFGERVEFQLDDKNLWTLYLPRGVLHGFQALTETADICYRIDAEHDPRDDVAVRYDDPDLNRLLDEGRSEPDPDERAEIYQQISGVFAEQVYSVWAWYTPWAVAEDEDVHGILGPPLPGDDPSEPGEATTDDPAMQPSSGLANGHSLLGLWIDQ